MSRFDSARRAAFIQDLVGSLMRKPVDLLAFDEVRQRLRLRHLEDRGLKVVPLDLIVGSLGRAQEFTRAFFPRDDALRDRWTRLEDLAEGPLGFSPVELYLVGEAYFVVDGHHRVSVARSLGAESIEAWVKEFKTAAKVGAKSMVEDLVLERERVDFLATAGLEPADVDDFRVTLPGGYERLLDHIRTHRYFLGVEQDRAATLAEAVSSWRDRVYDPVIEVIRRHAVTNHYPDHTETDLYLFVMDHLHRLRELYGSDAVDAESAVVKLDRPAGARRRRGA
ncbi:MAG: hypothetical protein GY769_02220 [bacterium]|nr:hypothetical protein [bacterium]